MVNFWALIWGGWPEKASQTYQEDKWFINIHHLSISYSIYFSCGLSHIIVNRKSHRRSIKSFFFSRKTHHSHICVVVIDWVDWQLRYYLTITHFPILNPVPRREMPFPSSHTSLNQQITKLHNHHHRRFSQWRKFKVDRSEFSSVSKASKS